MAYRGRKISKLSLSYSVCASADGNWEREGDVGMEL
jgi:hypothetical protein